MDDQRRDAQSPIPPQILLEEDADDEDDEKGFASSEDAEVKLGEAVFSRPIAIQRHTLTSNPLKFVEESEASIDQEQDIRHDQALQYELFSRLPVPKEAWPELVEVMAQEYREQQARLRV